jgi:hypothetical protein
MHKWILAVAVIGGSMAHAQNVGRGQMRHCPTAVSGAKTEVTDTPEGVQLTVTGKDEAEIRRRAKHLAEVAAAEPEVVDHQGNGHGGGGLGGCLVVLKDTTITAEEVAGGAKLAVKANKPVDVPWLQKETRARQAAAKPAAKKTAKK